MSAVRRVARLLGGLPADIPANPEALRRGLNIMTPASAGMTKQRWANVRALLTAALDLTGAKVVGQRQKIELTPSWSSLWNRVGDTVRAVAPVPILHLRFGEGSRAGSSQ